MKLCIKYKIKPTKEQEQYLESLGFYATKLYNTDNYMRREQWDKTGKIPSWYIQKKALKENHWYKLLPSQTAQQVCKNLQENYNSWFQHRKTDATTNPPMFRNKNKLSPLTFYQQFKIENDAITFSMSRKFKEETGIGNLSFKFDKWKEINGLPKTCNILKEKNNWMVHVVYEIPEKSLKEAPEIMACDIGIINLVSTVDTNGNSNLFSGKQVLAVQHYFNSRKGRVQSKLNNQFPKRHKSKCLNNLNTKQRKQENQIMHTISKEVVKQADKNNVGIIVVGNIKNIRRDKHWNKKSSQKLHSWGFSKLISQIEYKAKLSGIRVEKISEKDTSKTCSNCGIIKGSNRKHRGLYKCKCGNTINADLNGATNILKKYLRENNISRSIGHVARPLIWRCTNVIPS